MATAGGVDPTAASTSAFVATNQPVMVYSCNRLGRVANPPSFSLADWLLFRRRWAAYQAGAAERRIKLGAAERRIKPQRPL